MMNATVLPQSVNASRWAFCHLNAAFFSGGLIEADTVL